MFSAVLPDAVLVLTYLYSPCLSFAQIHYFYYFRSSYLSFNPYLILLLLIHSLFFHSTLIHYLSPLSLMSFPSVFVPSFPSLQYIFTVFLSLLSLSLFSPFCLFSLPFHFFFCIPCCFLFTFHSLLHSFLFYFLTHPFLIFP